MQVNCKTCGDKTDNVKLKRINGVDELVCLNCIHQRGNHNERTNAKAVVPGIQAEDGTGIK